MSRSNQQRSMLRQFATAATVLALSGSPFHLPQASSFTAASAPKSWGWRPEITRGGGGGGRLIHKATTVPAAATELSKDPIMGDMTPKEKLDSLRSAMGEKGIDVYLIPSDDPHLSEYVPDAYMRRKFVSGFGGSAGTAVVTNDEALLWTDSRYWNEASLQLDSEHWTLQKSGQPQTPTIPKFLAEMAAKKYADSASKEPLVVGIDPFVHPASFVKDVNDAFAKAAEKEFDDEDIVIGRVDTSNSNLIDPIWGENRPPVPTSPFRVHPMEYAGTSVEEKVADIRKEMKEKKASLAVFCALDDVAYLLNMRAKGDVDTCPVGIAYATITKDDVAIYCDERKLQSEDVKEHLKDVQIRPYDQIVADIEAHCKEDSTHKVWLDTSRANFALTDVIPEKALVDSQNAVTPMKALKNKAELEGMRKAHIVDGAAMAKFMAWMVDRINVQGKTVSEVEIDEVLTGFRAEQPGFVECSFPTIAGVGPNAAIIHYRATEGSDIMRHLDDKSPILIDSGGQYLYGTTDVTRTWHFGTATDQFKDTYTRVLKGNIGLDSMIFPENSPGFVLDVFARKSLWEVGLDYGHGTGHGVGAALNVHEGPFGISPRFANMEGLKSGMVVSNEPGYYEDGSYGIRIENLLEIQYVNPEHNEEKDADDTAKPSGKKFLKFSKLTQIPIQKNLIKIEMLTEAEMDWLDAYHEGVFAKVSPLLEPESPAMEWLKKSCEKVERP